MTRKLKREDDLVERLEDENRKLKAEVRLLHKRLKKIDRDYAVVVETIKKEQHELIDSMAVKNTCHHCGKGEIIKTVLLGRTFEKCDTCDWKKNPRTK